MELVKQELPEEVTLNEEWREVRETAMQIYDMFQTGSKTAEQKECQSGVGEEELEGRDGAKRTGEGMGRAGARGAAANRWWTSKHRF